MRIFRVLETLFSFAAINKYRLHLTGDFDISILGRSSSGDEFQNTLESFGFSGVIQCFRRITLNSEFIIGLFITHIHKNLVRAGTLTN